VRWDRKAGAANVRFSKPNKQARELTSESIGATAKHTEHLVEAAWVVVVMRMVMMAAHEHGSRRCVPPAKLNLLVLIFVFYVYIQSLKSVAQGANVGNGAQQTFELRLIDHIILIIGLLVFICAYVSLWSSKAY